MVIIIAAISHMADRAESAAQIAATYVLRAAAFTDARTRLAIVLVVIFL